MNRKEIALGAMFVAFALLLAVMIGTMPSVPATAAPPAAPTPITMNAREADPRIANFWGIDEVSVAASGRSSCFDLSGYNNIDLFYKIDQTTTNTVTLKLQYSNDLVTYVDGINVVADNAADANALAPFPVFGRYTCVYATVTNTNTLGITVIGVAK